MQRPAESRPGKGTSADENDDRECLPKNGLSVTHITDVPILMKYHDRGSRYEDDPTVRSLREPANRGTTHGFNQCRFALGCYKRRKCRYHGYLLPYRECLRHRLGAALYRDMQAHGRRYG